MRHCKYKLLKLSHNKYKGEKLFLLVKEPKHIYIIGTPRTKNEGFTMQVFNTEKKNPQKREGVDIKKPIVV